VDFKLGHYPTPGPLYRFVVRVDLCTMIGEIHRLSPFLHLFPQIQSGYGNPQLVVSRELETQFPPDRTMQI
jgi:hypothetical protein